MYKFTKVELIKKYALYQLQYIYYTNILIINSRSIHLTVYESHNNNLGLQPKTTMRLKPF